MKTFLDSNNFNIANLLAQASGDRMGAGAMQLGIARKLLGGKKEEGDLIEGAKEGIGATNFLRASVYGGPAGAALMKGVGGGSQTAGDLIAQKTATPSAPSAGGGMNLPGLQKAGGATGLGANLGGKKGAAVGALLDVGSLGAQYMGDKQAGAQEQSNFDRQIALQERQQGFTERDTLRTESRRQRMRDALRRYTGRV